jgi:D-alanine-D-alanine ligase
MKKMKEIASTVYHLCDCSWFARIDFFLHKNKIYLNEINTLPWFTDISMFPMLMKNTGLTYKQLINKTIELAF